MHTSLNITYIYLILHDNFNDLYCTPLWAWECCVQYKIHLNRVHLTTPLSSKPPRFVAVLPHTNGVWSVDSSSLKCRFVKSPAKFRQCICNDSLQMHSAHCSQFSQKHCYVPWALYLTRQFIMLEILCATQLESKFLSVPLKTLQVCFVGKSINSL